jgi:NADH dehydrogenase FAD-containing subunit
MPRPSVIVIGAGPGGLAAVHRLLASRQVDVTLVQPEGIATFLPGILPVLSGLQLPDNYRHAIELEGVHVRPGEVVALETGRVHLTDGTAVVADAILAAPGLVTDAV